MGQAWGVVQAGMWRVEVSTRKMPDRRSLFWSDIWMARRVGFNIRTVRQQLSLVPSGASSASVEVAQDGVSIDIRRPGFADDP